MRTAKLLALVTLLVPVSACTHPGSARDAHDDRPHGIYRLDYVLTANDAKPETFSQTVEEEDTSLFHAGRNVPLLTGASVPTPRQDVGLKVKSLLQSHQGRLVLGVEFEQSAPENEAGALSLRKVTTYGRAVLTPGTPTTIFRLDEGQKHYDLAVTATRL